MLEVLVDSTFVDRLRRKKKTPIHSSAVLVSSFLSPDPAQLKMFKTFFKD